jgi:hypothetical protein
MTELKPKRKIQSYDRHSVVPIGYVLPLIKNVRKAKEQLNGIPVGVSSLRLQTFAAKGLTCVKCGAKAEYFAIERDFGKVESDGHYHLNLWGTDNDGDPLLFTHDHILARALGGKDALENTQTMCCHCNWEKGDAEKIIVEQLREQK